MDLELKNAERYYDLTAYEALKNVSDIERLKSKNVIYVCSQFGGNIEKNQRKFCKYCKFIIKKGYIPMAVNLMFPRFMDDFYTNGKKKAILMSLDIISRCDELWCFGEYISNRMIQELIFARKHMIKIRYFTSRCEPLFTKGIN